ncbi:MAG: DegV family protein [Anaerolineaceae bacterium]
MIEIITDSCSDLSKDLMEQYHIHQVQLQVLANGKNYLDCELSPSELYRIVEETGQLPKTSAPPVADFLKLFNNYSESIFIGISSKLSATIQSATLAAEELDNHNIRIIDSLNLSTGIGLLVVKAAEMRDQGLSSAEIEHTITTLVPKVRSSFIIDTLEYMYKGGRCSAMENIVGSLLQIKPIIEVKPDGTLGVKEKIRGSRKKGLNSLLTNFKKELPDIDLERVFITHTGCDEDAEYLKSELNSLATIRNITITRAGATITSHCGPNTIGILYLLK